MMSIQSAYEILQKTPLLSELNPDFLMLLVGCAQPISVAADTYLLHEGGEANQFYIIHRGQVAIEINDPRYGQRIIETLQDGDVVGWSWLFEPYQWHFDVRTNTVLDGLVFDAVCLRAKCQVNHSLGFALMRCFSQMMLDRLEAMRRQVLDVYGKQPS